MSFRRGLSLVAGLAVAGLVFTGSPALAQTTSASVSGVVHDTQGAVLPGVTVTLKSQTQGNAVTTTTDGEGRFIFAIVRPDTYTLQASLQGFRTVERTKVVVSAADDQRRTIVRPRERGAQEHRQRRALPLRFCHAGAGCAAAGGQRRREHGRPGHAGERVHGERPAAELQQHDN